MKLKIKRYLHFAINMRIYELITQLYPEYSTVEPFSSKQQHLTKILVIGM